MTCDIDQFLAARNLPNVVAVATTGSKNFYEGAFGTTQGDGGTPVHIDTPYAIMSMTKPIASVAIMRLVEKGDLDLDAAAIDYVPQYADISVLDQVNPAEKTYTTKPLAEPFTVRQLLNHTAGFAYSFCNETLTAFGPESDKPGFPLMHQPGEKWTYGINTRILGEIITAVTGKDLEDALKALVLDPLDMGNTTFMLQADQVTPHLRDGDTWSTGNQFPYSPLADAGLISTARDYAKFVRCLLNAGAPVLSEASCSAMINNQIGCLSVRQMPAANKTWTQPFPRGGGVDKFGLGFQIHHEVTAGMRSKHSFSWCGLMNTFFWVDPAKQIGGIILMQTTPLFDPYCLETLDGFERLVYAQGES